MTFTSNRGKGNLPKNKKKKKKERKVWGHKCNYVSKTIGIVWTFSKNTFWDDPTNKGKVAINHTASPTTPADKAKR